MEKAALIGVIMLLLGPDVAQCEQCFMWTANTDTATTGYNIYTRPLGMQDWGEPHIIPGINTTLACVDLPAGTYEATITAWGYGETYVDPVTSGESGYFLPPPVFTVDPKTCPVPVGFRVQ